jgi:hypothetical protein
MACAHAAAETSFGLRNGTHTAFREGTSPGVSPDDASDLVNNCRAGLDTKVSILGLHAVLRGIGKRRRPDGQQYRTKRRASRYALPLTVARPPRYRIQKRSRCAL